MSFDTIIKNYQKLASRCSGFTDLDILIMNSGMFEKWNEKEYIVQLSTNDLRAQHAG